MPRRDPDCLGKVYGVSWFPKADIMLKNQCLPYILIHTYVYVCVFWVPNWIAWGSCAWTFDVAINKGAMIMKNVGMLGQLSKDH